MMLRGKNPFVYSLRAKLSLISVIILVVPMVGCAIYAVRAFGRFAEKQAKEKVRSDLVSLAMIYKNREKQMQSFARAISRDNAVRVAVSLGRGSLLGTRLGIYVANMLKKGVVDMVTITDANGLVMARGKNPELEGDDLSDNELVKIALGDQAAVGTQIVSKEDLVKEGLVSQAGLGNQTIQTGMMIQAAAPIYYDEGIVGTVITGCLLNNNLGLLKEIEEAKINLALLQKGRIILTNLSDKRGKSILGERIAFLEDALNPESMEKITLKEKDYITDYYPIKDFNQNPVGLIVVTKDVERISQMKRGTVIGMVFIFFLGLSIAVGLAWGVGCAITKPLQHLLRVTEKVAKGDLTYPIKVESKDEIGDLAHSFAHMTPELRRSRGEIEDYNRTLEQRVEERTKQLKETQAQLFQSSKLAAVGELAAGVAHELNNPIGGILGYAQYVSEKINNIGDLTAENVTKFNKYLDYIEKASQRCKSIVDGLLRFSRAEPIKFEPLDVNQVLKETIGFIHHQLTINNIQLSKELCNNPPRVMGNPNQLQQVFTNIILNAQKVMSQGGDLKVCSKFNPQQSIMEIEFTDTGCGIPDENLTKIFDPFFTTGKVGEGTGLGLSVSYGILKAHGGEIKVQSEVGKGTKFTVILPVRDSSVKEMINDQ